MPMPASCCGVAVLGRIVDALASGCPALTCCLRVRARNSSWVLSVAWRPIPKSDVVPIGLHAVVSWAMQSRCVLFMWAGSSFLGGSRWSKWSFRRRFPGREGLSLFLGQLGFSVSHIRPYWFSGVGSCSLSVRGWVGSPGRSLSAGCLSFSGFSPCGVHVSCSSSVGGEAA